MRGSGRPPHRLLVGIVDLSLSSPLLRVCVRVRACVRACVCVCVCVCCRCGRRCVRVVRACVDEAPARWSPRGRRAAPRPPL